MRFDYEEVLSNAIKLNRCFKNITTNLDKIEKNNKSLCSSSNWNSKAQEHFQDNFNNLKNSFDIINNKFNNINLYIDNVINNYKSLDK